MRSMIFADHNVYFGNIEKLKSRYNRKRLLDIYIIMEIYTRGFVDITLKYKLNCTNPWSYENKQ